MGEIKKALSIAGSDPCAGAGLQADLKTFHAHGVYGLTAVTAVTVQNTQQVGLVQEMPSKIVRDQIVSLFEDITIQVVKIGMVFSPPIIRSIVQAAKIVDFPFVVLDPVMVSESGYVLLKEEAQRVLVEELFPLADLVMPNVHEAERLTGRSIKAMEDMKSASRELMEMGPAQVLIKGGHFTGAPGVDVLDLGWKTTELRPKFVSSSRLHGTGCTYSSAIAANIALGESLEAAVQKAKDYISLSIQNYLDIGMGNPVLKHFV